MDKLKDAAYRAAGRHFQLNSVQQLSQILYENLKLDQKASIKVKATMSRGAKSTSISMVLINGVITRNSNILHGSNTIILNGLHTHTLTFIPVQFSACNTLKVTRLERCNPYWNTHMRSLQILNY
jgi:hypothetical protein